MPQENKKLDVLLPVVGGSHDVDVLSQSSQRCVNWYPEIDQFGGQHQLILRPTPGMKAFSTLGAKNSVRGLMEYRGVLYGVGDHTLYSIDSSGTETSLGNLDATATLTSTPVKWCASGGNILIVDHNKAYIYNIDSASLNQISDTDFPSSVDDGTAHDGYFIVVQTNTENFFVSAAADPTDWNALDFASSNASGDYLRACVSDQRELWLFGDKTVEVYFTIASPDLPFQKREGVLLQKGIAAIHSLVKSDNSIYWLAKDEYGQNLVVRAEGYNPKNITNMSIANKISRYTTVSDAIGYVHREGIHEFYVLSFPTEDVTWVYDAGTGLWHERQSYVNNAYQRHIGNCVAYFNGKSLVGDYQSNNIFEYDEATYDENGARLLRRRTSQPLYFNNKSASLYNFQLDFEPGVGLVTGQGSSPQVMLAVSTDGGHTYGNTTYRSLGAMGDYSRQVKWDALGLGFDWVFDIQITDPVNAVLLGATADIEV